MGWLLEDLLGVRGDGECLQGQVTRALACRHCISITCLQSPGNLMIIFLFMIWQIRRWWQLRRWQQLQLWYSGDLMQGKGLQLLHYLDFLDHLWKQNSEEEEESEEEKEEEPSLGPLKPHSPSNEVPIGNQDTTAPQQPSYSSERLTKTTGSPEEILTQPSNSFRSYPTFQILTNLPVRNTTSRSSLKQENTQFFWGLPSLHSESLDMIFLNSCGSSPPKLSVCPSVFNKVAFLPMYNLLFSCYHCPTHYHTSEAQTMEDLEGMLSGSQLAPSPSSPASPSLSFHIKSLPKDCKGVLSDAGSHAQWQREIPWVSDNQTLCPLPELQRIRPFTLLNSSEVWREMSWDPNFQQHNPASPSTCLLYPSSSQRVLTKFKVPRMTMRQNEHPKTSELIRPTPSPGPAFLPECKTVIPVDLSRSKALWEVTEQKENPHISESSVLAPCQSVVLMAESQGTGPPGIPFGYETQWGTIEHKENPQDFESLMSAACQLSESLSELQVNPKRGLSAPEGFWETVGYIQNPQVAKSPVPVPCPHLDSMSDLQKESPLEDLSLCKPWWQCRENSGRCWAAESRTLNLSIAACASSASETGWKCRQNTDNSWDAADPVLSPNLSSVSVVMGPQLEPKASCKTKEQREKFWASNSPDPAHEAPLVPFTESQRINTMDGFPRSEATWKDTENSRNSWVSESLSLALSPSPSFELEAHRISHTEELLSSHIPFTDSQRKNSLASEFPAHRLPQHLHEAYHLGVLVDPQPVAGDMKQKKNSCVWNPSSPLHSASKSHLSEPLGDLHNSKWEGVEQKKDFWATELPVPSSVFAPSQEPHDNLEVVFKNAQETEAPQGPNSPVVNSLHPTPWSPMLAKTIHPSLQKEEVFSEAKAEAPSSQSEPVPEVMAYPETHAWQWSKELKSRLKKLHQNPAFESSGPSRSYSSSFVLNSTPDPWEISSCPPLHTHPISLHPSSPSCHNKKVQSTVLQPTQDPYVTHSSSQFPLPVFGRAEQKPQIKQRIKGKMVAQIPSPGGIHIGAGKNSLGMGEPSTAGVLALCERKDKVSAPKKASPRKPKAGEYGGGNARMGSSTVIGRSHSAQAWRPTEAPVSKVSKRSWHRDQSSVHTALPQQVLKGTDAHNERRVRLTVGDVQHLHHCEHCPLAHMERQLPSSTFQAPLNSFQRVLAKFLGTHRPLSTKSN